MRNSPFLGIIAITVGLGTSGVCHAQDVRPTLPPTETRPTEQAQNPASDADSEKAKQTDATSQNRSDEVKSDAATKAYLQEPVVLPTPPIGGEAPVAAPNSRAIQAINTSKSPQPKNQQAVKVEPNDNTESWSIFTATLFTATAAAILLLVMALSNRVVVFYDIADVAMSFFAACSLAVGVYMMSSFDVKSFDSWLSVGAGILIFAGLALMTVMRSIKHNGSVALGVFVGICKLVMSALGVFIMFSALLRVINGNRRETLFAIALLLVFGWLASVFINGPKVEEARLERAAA